MDLLSVFKRKSPTDELAAPDAADAVQLARTRARQRLIGAAVLVVAGIIGFPLLFETQPRPIPVDLLIEIPRKDNVPPLAMPNAPPDVRLAPPPLPARPAAPAERVITETQADAGREIAPASSAVTGAVPAELTKAGLTAQPAPTASVAAASHPGMNDGARARALLEGKPTASAAVATASAGGTARFVVQVGAFTEPAAVRDARARVEQLGMKTYTQVAETPAGPRTRVRVGPFATRDDAERAAARIKATSMPAIILTL